MRDQRQRNYCYPGFAEDKLFASAYQHKHRRPWSCDLCNRETQNYCAKAANASCAELGCDEGQLVSRRRLEEKRNLGPKEAQCPEIFIGRIASGDTVMKSSENRDQIAKQHNVIAFEMEGAGIWGEVPCVVVKGAYRLSQAPPAHKPGASNFPRSSPIKRSTSGDCSVRVLRLGPTQGHTSTLYDK